MFVLGHEAVGLLTVFCCRASYHPLLETAESLGSRSGVVAGQFPRETSLNVFAHLLAFTHVHTALINEHHIQAPP